MTTENITEKAAELMGIELDANGESEDARLLSACAGYAATRISGEFTDLKAKQKAVSVDGKISYEQFSKPVKRIIKVVKNDEKRPFEEESDGITVSFDGEADVTYAYYSVPREGGEIDLPPKFGAYVVALGSAGEFCYRKGLYKEAEVYDKRFAAALDNVLSDVRSVTVKAVTR